MLATNQLYQIISQLMPQIQDNLRKKIKQQYQFQIRSLHTQYRNKITQINNQHNIQIQNLRNNANHKSSKIRAHNNSQNSFQSQSIEIQLRKQLSALQRQRLYYLRQQQQYRNVILNLTKDNNRAILSRKKIQEKTNSQNNIQNKEIDLQTTQKFEKQQPNQNNYQANHHYHQNSNSQRQCQKSNIFEKYFATQNQQTLTPKSHILNTNCAVNQKYELQGANSKNYKRINLLNDRQSFLINFESPKGLKISQQLKVKRKIKDILEQLNEKQIIDSYQNIKMIKNINSFEIYKSPKFYYFLMGAICVNKENVHPTMQVTFQKIQQSNCKFLIFEYIKNYGTKNGDQLSNWISSSYQDSYTSNALFINFPSKVYLKRDLYQVYNRLKQKGWKAKFIRFQKISIKQDDELIQYTMVSNGPTFKNPNVRGDYTYLVTSLINAKQMKFKTSIFKQVPNQK